MNRALLLDLGNTRLKWAWYEDGRLRPGPPVVHRDAPLGPRLNEALRGVPTPGAILVCAVAAPEVQGALKAWLQGRWPLHPVFVRPQGHAHGITCGYRDPRRLGADRWVALVGAHHHHGGDLCLFDCGSALTYDALDREGRHLGGAIAPGLGLMRRQLEETLGLGHGDGRVEPNLLAQDTEDGIATGIHHAAAAFVERAHARIDQGAGRWRVLLTGGDAETVAGLLALPAQIDPLLVLRGLATIAEQMQ